jgi:hypothetical protein
MMGSLLSNTLGEYGTGILPVNKKELKMKFKNGSILVLAVIMVAILLIIGLALIRLGLNSRLQAIHSQMVISAKTAADAGITRAVKRMRYAFENGLSLPVSPEVDASLAGSDPPATYTYTIKSVSANKWELISTGTAGTTQRIVHSTLNRKPIPAIAVQNTIWVQDVDFPCGTVIMQTNSVQTKPPAVTVKAGVTIPGDVVCGPGGDPAEVIDTKDSTIITGFAYAAEEPVPFPPVVVPANLVTLPKTAYIFDSDPNISGDRHYGNMDITGIQNITGPTRIFVEGDLTMFNGAGVKELVVKTGASLELYLNGKLETKNSGVLDNETGVATNFKIFGTPTCTQIDLKAKSGSLAVAVYAPSADVTLFNSATIYGTIAANNFTMKLGGSFCADANSANYTLDAAQGSWWEE